MVLPGNLAAFKKPNIIRCITIPPGSVLNDFNGEICTIDAEKISMETLGKNFPNTPMLAAVVKVSGVIDENRFINDMEESFRHKFYHKPEMVEGNMKALKKSMKEVRVG